MSNLFENGKWPSSHYLFLHQGLASPKLTTEFSSLQDEFPNVLSSTTEFPSRHSELEPYVPYHERLETYIVPIVFAIMFIIGVLGNGTLILIFLRHRTMRNVPNMYICSLAVGDILVIFFCVPFTSTVYTVDSWPYGVVVCKFSEFIKDVSIGVSVFTLTALSADRYFAIVDPMRKLVGRRATRVTCLTIAGIWIISILISLPSAIFSYVRTFNETEHIFMVCYPFPEELGPLYPKIMVLFKALVYYFVPLVFIASFYAVMAYHLVLSTRNMPGEAQGQGRQIQARKKVAKMVLSFAVIFAICFFPSHVFLLWFYFVPDAEENYTLTWHIIRILGFCLSFLNSCINPITLYCVSGTFRKYFNGYLFCCATSDHHPRTSMKSLCCPNISRVERRRGYRQTNRAASFNSDACRLGDVNGSPSIHSPRRASTMTSTTSLRTKVTWDSPNKSPTPSQRQFQNFLTVDNGGGNRRTSTHLHPRSKEREERFHLYPNPNRRLNDPSPASITQKHVKENEITMTSFIETECSKLTSSIENLK